MLDKSSRPNLSPRGIDLRVAATIIAFTRTYPDEKQASAVDFVQQATRYVADLLVPIERVLTDNGSAFRAAAFAGARKNLGIAQKFTRAHRPQTHGKAERFIQSARREWAYGHADENSEQRGLALPVRNHFDNWHRQHHGIGCWPPISRLLASSKNLLTFHSQVGGDIRTDRS